MIKPPHPLDIVLQQIRPEGSDVFEVTKNFLATKSVSTFLQESKVTYLFTSQVHHLFPHSAPDAVPQAWDIQEGIQGRSISPATFLVEQSLQILSFVLTQACPPLTFGVGIPMHAVEADLAVDMPVRRVPFV